MFSPIDGNDSDTDTDEEITLAELVIMTTSALNRRSLPDNNWQADQSLVSIREASPRPSFIYHPDRYVYASDCRIHFDWADNIIVGQTMSFTVKFFQRNGQPHPICDMDYFNVKVSVGCGSVATRIQLGHTDPELANQAVVQFRPKRAGSYTIEAKIGANHVAGSPSYKMFRHGPADPKMSKFKRASSTYLCMVGIHHIMSIDPRDEYDNRCDYVTPQAEQRINDFKVVVAQIHNPTMKNDSDDNDKENKTKQQQLLPANDIVHGDPELAFDKLHKRIAIDLRFVQVGFYRATICLNGQQITNGEFEIVVLDKAEYQDVRKNVARREPGLCYEAKMLSWQGRRYSKPRDVMCFISNKQITIKKRLFKYFQTTVATFKLTPLTKIYFNRPRNKEREIFIIDDGSQTPMELSSDYRYVIAATVSLFTLENVGGNELFSSKRQHFYREVYRRYESRSQTKVELVVERPTLLHTSYKATKRYSLNQWCGRLEIVFQGEPGIDRGGIAREWCELLCIELFEPGNSNGLFAVLGDKANDQHQQQLVHPTSKRALGPKLQMYEFAGQIVGKCLFESSMNGAQRNLVRARFTRSFLAQLLGRRVDHRHFEYDDPEFYRSKIKFILDNDLTAMDMELFFAEEEYGEDGKLIKVVDLIPDGRSVRVTNDTKLQYVNALARHRLANDSIKRKVKAFLKGLTLLIPLELLRIFNEKELELLMSGVDEYSAEDLRAYHEITGYSREFKKVLDWFWQAVEGFTREELARLLQFTTGSSRLPLKGFQKLDPPFTIVDTGGYGHLPTAHTCVNQLCLPDYKSYEDLERALHYALKEGAEGFGLV